MRKRFGSGIQREYVGARVDTRIVDDLKALVLAGVVPNRSDGVERALKLLLAVHRSEIDAYKRESEVPDAAD